MSVYGSADLKEVIPHLLSLELWGLIITIIVGGGVVIIVVV